MRKALAISMVAGAVVIGASIPASATTGKGSLFHDGAVVGTVVVPVAIPGQGTDPFYSVTNGATEWETWRRSAAPCRASTECSSGGADRRSVRDAGCGDAGCGQPTSRGRRGLRGSRWGASRG